jgi:xylulokinase
LHTFGLEAAQLAQPLAPGTTCGRTVAAAASLLGLPAGIPFAVGAIDHHAAAIGSGLGRFADVSISTGTVLAALALVERVAPVSGCYHGPHVDGRTFYRLAFDPNGAGQLEDYQRTLAPDRSIEELLALAAQAPIGGRGPEAAGRERSGPAHGGAVRAILERVAVTHRSLVRQAAGGRTVTRVIATGGGARSPLWLQIDADVLEAAVVRPASPERACLGAAAFAAVAAGWHASLADAVAAMVHPDCAFEPNEVNASKYRRLFREVLGE